MIQYTYDKELITITSMMLNAISTIVIKRFNVHRQARDQIKTRVVYAPKQRVLNDLLNRDQNLQLPVIAVSIGGITRDQNRVWNKILGTFNSKPGSSSSNYEKTPLPIDIVYNMSIMTRYQEDMDQIISHIIPYINPYFVISWRTPQRPDFEIRSNVFWNGNVNITYPFDIAATQVARIVAELSFTFKGWMFQSIQDPVENVHSFNINFSDTTLIPTEFQLEPFSDELREDISSRQSITSRFPTPKVIIPYSSNVGEKATFEVWGSGFENIQNVYLSGAPLNSISTTQNPFSSFPNLSAEFGPFTAVKLASADWSYNRDTYMTFTMPSATNSGRVDVIVQGPLGYGKLTQGVRYSNLNPYPPQSLEWSNHVPYQMKYLQGIEII
jgi:hypothetical protein